MSVAFRADILNHHPFLPITRSEPMPGQVNRKKKATFSFFCFSLPRLWQNANFAQALKE
jgi:hypothetical protein